MTVVYNAGGDQVNAATNVGRANLPPARYVQPLSSGILIRRPIDLPAKEVYFLCFGVHDLASDRVEAVESPVCGLKSLQAMIQAARRSAPPRQ